MKGKRIAGIICAGLGCLGLIGLAKSYSAALLVGSIVLLIVGAVLIALSLIKKKKAPEAKQPAPAEPKKPQIETASARFGNIYHDEYVLRYRFVPNLADPDILAARGHAGALVSFDGASVMFEGHEIGLLKNQTHVQMVDDYTRRGDPIVAYILAISDTDLIIDIGFFKNKKDLRVQECKLAGGSQYQEARDCYAVGDTVNIFEDDEHVDRYIVDTGSDVIGIMPSSIVLNTNHVIVGEIIQNDDGGCVIRFYP